MPRILLLTPNRRDLFHAPKRALETLGIEVVTGQIDSSFSTTIWTDGLVVPSANVRAFLRNFNAVFVLERQAISSSDNSTRHALETWINWNADEDTPVVLFGPNLSTARTALTLPSDFPIVRPDPNDLANTVSQVDSNTFASTGSVPNGGTSYPRLGARVRLTRENLRVYTPTYCAFNSTNAYFWRLDEIKHLLLGTNGEILAVPDFPDQSFPPDTLIAYRYYKHFILPGIEVQTERMHPLRHSQLGTLSIFWLLYALKLVGIQPARQAILCFEIDHPIITRPDRTDLTAAQQQLVILRETYRWLIGFQSPAQGLSLWTILPRPP